MKSRPTRVVLTICLAFLAGVTLRYLGVIQAVNPLFIVWVAGISLFFCFRARSMPGPARPTELQLVRYQTLPAPSGLDAEVMRLLVPGKRTDLRLLLCKVRDCGAVLITHHEYWPDALHDTDYATDLGWREIKVPDQPTAWYCPNHVKSTQQLLG